jgi:hypothetical protein
LFGPDVTVEALTPEGAMTAEEITQATEKALQYPTAKKFPDPTEEDIAIADATMPAEEKAEVGRVVDAWSAYIAERGITDPKEMIQSWRETAAKNKLPKMYIDQVEKRLKESLGING